MALKFDKPDGLGVLDSYERVELLLNGIRTNLRNKDRERGIKDALKNLKNAKRHMTKGIKHSKALLKNTDTLIAVLKGNFIPMIMEKKRGKDK